MAEVTSFLASSTLLAINGLSLLTASTFFIEDVWSFFGIKPKYVGVLFVILACLFNYLVLYKNGCYKEVFEHFDHNLEDYDKWKSSVPIYIISSIVFMLVVLAIADYRFDGHF